MIREVEFVMSGLEREIKNELTGLMHDSQPAEVVRKAYGHWHELVHNNLPEIRRLKREKSPLYIAKYIDCVDHYCTVIEDLKRRAND